MTTLAWIALGVVLTIYGVVLAVVYSAIRLSSRISREEEQEAAETVRLSAEDMARIDEICASAPVVTDAMREAILNPKEKPDE